MRRVASVVVVNTHGRGCSESHGRIEKDKAEYRRKFCHNKIVQRQSSTMQDPKKVWLCYFIVLDDYSALPLPVRRASRIPRGPRLFRRLSRPRRSLTLL